VKQQVKTAIAALVPILSVGIAFGETTITINGRTIQSSGGSIFVTNDTIIVGETTWSGKGVRGSGKSASEYRSLNDFQELRLDISADVTVKRGDRTRCKITADDNILPLILTEISGNALLITARESYESRQKVTVEIEVPLLKKAQVNGSGTINMAGVEEEELVLVVNGSGDIHTDGMVATLGATINGSGNLRASDLQAERIMVTLNGSGNAYLHATDALVVKINGSGDVSYSGTPSEFKSFLNGSGHIRKK